jgi:GT2 family glycosyltransferase
MPLGGFDPIGGGDDPRSGTKFKADPASTKVCERLVTLPTSASAAADVLVVILNFNGLADTLACLESLYRQTWQDFAVMVIDNASRADDLSAIARRFPSVEIVALPENRGWAGGNNVGLQRALDHGFDFVCLLNNDTLLGETAFAELMQAARVIGAPSLLHPAIFYFDEPQRAQLWPTPPDSPDAAIRLLRSEHDIVEMNWAYGACLVLPAPLLRRVGLLDERFFLQLEEQDYYRRAVAAGFASYCARRARILHKESASFGGQTTPTKIYYLARNTLLFAEKHKATLLALPRTFYDLLGTLQNRARATGIDVETWPALLRWFFSAEPLARAAREGIGDYFARRFGPRPLSRWRLFGYRDNRAR